MSAKLALLPTDDALSKASLGNCSRIFDLCAAVKSRLWSMLSTPWMGDMTFPASST